MKKGGYICFCISALFILISGCATFEKPTYIQSTGVHGLKSYAWLNDSQQIEGELRTDKYSLDMQIRKSVDDVLSTMGYAKVAREKADFYINYKLSILTENKVMFKNEVSPSVKEMDKGSMVIEAVNPRTGELMWQGEQKAKIYRYDFIESRLRFVNNSINQILSNFPSE